MTGRMEFERLESGHLILPVEVGEHTLACVVDTGASLSILTPEAASRLGLVEADGEMVEGQAAGGELGGIAVHRLGSVRIGGERYEELEFAVTDLSHIERKIGRSLPGIIGANLLTRHVVEIDFESGWIALHPADALQEGALSVAESAGDAAFGAFDVVPGLMRFSPRLAGVEVDAVFDLGAARTVVNRAAGRLVRAELDALPAADPPLLGANAEPIDARDLRAGSLCVGEAELGPTVICVADLAVFAVLGMAPERPAMIFGLEPLQGRRLVIDYGAGRLYVG